MTLFDRVCESFFSKIICNLINNNKEILPAVYLELFFVYRWFIHNISIPLFFGTAATETGLHDRSLTTYGCPLQTRNFSLLYSFISSGSVFFSTYYSSFIAAGKVTNCLAGLSLLESFKYISTTHSIFHILILSWQVMYRSRFHYSFITAIDLAINC